MPAAAYGQIYGFSADNLANKISAAYYVYPHLSTVRIYASTFLRIYISAAIIRGTPTHLHCRFRCRQHNNTRELNRTDVTNNDDFDARGGTKHSIVAEIHVMEGVAGEKLMSNMSDTTTPVLNQHTCVVLTCPPPSLSSGNYLCFVQSATHSSPLISHCVSIAVVTKVAGCIIIATSSFNRHNLHPPFYFPHFTSTNHSLTFFVRISGWPSRRLRRAATLP